MFNKKKSSLLIFGCLIIAVIIVSIPSLIEARINNNDQVIVQSAIVDNVATHLLVASETTPTSTVAVDLSDVTNYPHYMNAGIMEISQIRLDYSADSAASTTIKFGVIASSTPAGNVTDIYWFDQVNLSLSGENGSEHISQVLDYSPSVMKLNLSNGKPASFLTNDYSLWTSDYATTTPVLSPAGYAAPGVGDLVMKVYSQSGTATTSVTTIYRIREDR